MELLIEIILTVSLSLIVTSFFVKLVSMQPNNTDTDNLTEEPLKIDKFQHTPFKGEVIKLEEFPSEGKSSVELYNVLGVVKEDCKFQDIVVVDSKESETEDYNDNADEEDDDNDDDDDNKDDDGCKDAGFVAEEEEGNGGERKLCEIEIESEEEMEEIGIMDDWEEIGRKDFEELLGSKTGLNNVDVNFEK
ncbi:hypothetical protein SOVF_043070 [Spinacia oleracea]|uniref:Histone chaperone ASF1-like n=1 Tax=Spinacia oleracea TaxID=3562 RepID=A0A9R0JCN0_SPIOL|nr:histone chaperone ASF1-like [Spinacia oleracea]KNA21451.1 hypothetical protein SOVF_043070 [Spinacia oleracea]